LFRIFGDDFTEHNLTSAILNPMGILHIAVLADIQNIPICVIFFPNFKKKKKNSSHLNSDFCLVAF
jgi:hypothetical protein